MLNGKRVAAVVVAAGASRRMGFDKLLARVNGAEVLRLTVDAFNRHPAIDELVVVAGDNMETVRALFAAHPPQKPLAFARGGPTRTHSVAAGVAAAACAQLVAIHDGARPFVSTAVIDRALTAAAEYGAAAPALPLVDTVKLTGENGFVEDTLPRARLFAVQTPQVFDRAAFVAALAAVDEGEWPLLTDDCMVMERAGLPVRLVEGDVQNRKITHPGDLPTTGGLPNLRVGHGYDVHRLVAGRALVLGGVRIPCEKGLLGHSDADVLLHAVADALLGASGLGDIGRHFPDSDLAYENADSQKLLAAVAEKLTRAGFQPVNIDATVVCQAPKLAPHIEAMRANIAAACGLAPMAVNVKATTEEHLGFTGAGEGIAAHCVALVIQLA